MSGQGRWTCFPASPSLVNIFVKFCSICFRFFAVNLSAMTAITREILGTILDKKLDPLKGKIDSLIESIDFFDAKLGELNRLT